MSIPVQNLYYLLSYAWDPRLNQAALKGVDASACPDLNSLFARVLANGVRQLLRVGLDRSYVSEEETTPRIRGKIDFATSARFQTQRVAKLHCVFDEFSSDVLQNRILKAALRLVLADPAVDQGSREELSRLLPAFAGIGDMRLDATCFRRLQLHRNNRVYRFLLNLCELIHRSYLPDPSRHGGRKFRDILSDERTMAALFEGFVRHFAKRHLSGAQTGRMKIRWDISAAAASALALIPLMETDVTIVWRDRKLILDCKYYREALKGRFDLRFSSGNLYQLNAYLTNQASQAGWEDVEGMLLYPSNGYHLNEQFTLYGRHRVTIATLDLNQPWTAIHSQLLALLQQRPVAIGNHTA